MKICKHVFKKKKKVILPSKNKEKSYSFYLKKEIKFLVLNNIKIKNNNN